MGIYKLTEAENRFAEIIWGNAPLSSSDLVKLCEHTLDWKKSTTYTVLKKLCEKRLFCNDNATVNVLVTRAQYAAQRSHVFVEDSFGGSLPSFFAAFVSGKQLSEAEAAEIKRLIDEHVEG
ncbi:MAG: BlaI/MecI/CopY family transcriptional regulator [Clostridia bacterium]